MKLIAKIKITKFDYLVQTNISGHCIMTGVVKTAVGHDCNVICSWPGDGR